MIFILIGSDGRVVELADQVGATDAPEALFDAASFLWLVPEEVLALGQFLTWGLGTIDLFQRIRVVTCIPGFSGIGHRRRSEVLYLFQMEVKSLCDDCEFCHILLTTSRMGRYEVGNDLFAQVLFAVNTVEQALELIELLEGGLSHEEEHTFAGMFGCHLQPAADMMADQFTGVLFCGMVCSLVLAPI